MFDSQRIPHLIITALICLIMLEACESATSTGVSSGSITPIQVGVISPSKTPITPTIIPTEFFPTTPPNPVITSPIFTPLPIFQIDSWQGHWLNSRPCKPPCWEKIIPGQTTLSEAKNLLINTGLASTVTTEVVDAKATRGEMRWSWNDTLGLDKSKTANGGVIYYDNTNSQYIDIISPKFYVSYPLKDVTKVYGEPEYILALGYYPYPEAKTPLFSISAVYLTQGFMIGAINPDSKPINLASDKLFAFGMFFIPSNEGFNKIARYVNGRYDAKYLVKWQGFQNFAYYCRNLDKPAC